MEGQYIGIVSKHTLEEFLELHRRLEEKLLPFPNVYKKISGELNQLAAHKSAIQEFPHERLTHREVKEYQGAICEAFRNLNKKPFAEWTHEDIQDANTLIDFGQHPEGYRTSTARLNGVAGVSPQRISSDMEQVFTMLQSNINPLEQSILAHFHIIRIHPFFDGNKRTARIAQNTILKQVGILPFLMEFGERTFYLNLFEAARSAWRDTYDLLPISKLDLTAQQTLLYGAQGKALNNFADYIVSRIMIQYDNILSANVNIITNRRKK